MPEGADQPAKPAANCRDRLCQAALLAGTLYGSWLLMMVLHEFGHAIHGWASGATVSRVVIGPHLLSQTVFDENPHPLFAAWGGALWGSLLPLAVWGGLALAKSARAYLGRFLAAFCLVANGGYIGVGALTLAGDAGDMTLYGCPRWVPALVGLPLAALGLYLWHRQGRFFGIGSEAQPVRRADAVGVLVGVAVLAAAELALFRGAAA